MKAAMNPLQAAVYTLLTADTGAGGLFEVASPMINGVWDAAGVPEGTQYPYVTIGEMDSDFWGSFARNCEDLEMTLHVWTQAKGWKDAGDILTRLNQLVGDTALSVSGYSLARSTYRRYSRLNDPGQNIQHLMVVYRVLLQET